ncbi:MAG: hypothetical protein R8F63_07140 [Acidimicrobiales bacterium]|nr:hypothetical protein [Acidimicrobiales bacterium]
MHLTVHLAEPGLRGVPALRRSRPAKDTPGLRYAAAAVPAPLGSGGTRPMLGHVVHLGFWDDADDAEAAFADTPWGPDTFTGVRIDAAPVRAIGSWPGLPADLPTAADPVHDGPSFVLTIARLRLLQARRFFVAGAMAEKHVIASPGLSWGFGAAAPERRTLMTLSWWHDFAAMAMTVRGPGGHADAMARQAEKDFHHESAFVRFRPLAASGSLDGKHPVPEMTI